MVHPLVGSTPPEEQTEVHMESLCVASRSVGYLFGGADIPLPLVLSLSKSDVVYVWVGSKNLPCERSAQS